VPQEDDNGNPIIGFGNADLLPQVADGISVKDSRHVVLDHLSASWSMDEALSVTESKDVTVQHCMISESLNGSFHASGNHGFGSLIRGTTTLEDRGARAGGYTFFGNLYAHNWGRNPTIGGQQGLRAEETEDDRRGADVEFTNNLIYNWGKFSGRIIGPIPRRNLVRVNYIGNFLLAGPSATASNLNVVFVGASDVVFHREGNLLDSLRDGILDPHETLPGSYPDTPEAGAFLPGRLPFPPVTVVSAEEAYQRALFRAGASLRRDSIDWRVVSEVIEQNGRIIDSQEDVGGEVRIAGGFAPDDADRDGMPDAFETEFGLNPQDPLDRNGTELSAEGYTNLEVYLDSLVNEPFVFDSGFAAPEVTIHASPPSGAAPLEVVFQASGEAQAGHRIDFFEWIFHDGSTTRGARTSFKYEGPGRFPVVVRAVDDRGFGTRARVEVFAGIRTNNVFPWSSTDIGETATSGGARTEDDCIELLAGGGNITGNNHEIHLVYQELRGDFNLSARVDTIESSSELAMAGISARTDLDPLSRHASMLLQAGRNSNDAHFIWRRSRRGWSEVVPDTPASWIRLERAGNIFSGSISADGRNWARVHSEELDVPERLLVGLVATPNSDERSSQLTFAKICDVTLADGNVRYLRGDCNSDASLDLTDAAFVLTFLFANGPRPKCLDSCDFDADGKLDLTNAVFLLNFLFQSGPVMPPPRTCQGDVPTAVLGCLSSSCRE